MKISDPHLLTAIAKVGHIENIKLECKTLDFDLTQASGEDFSAERGRCNSLMRVNGGVTEGNAMLVVVAAGGERCRFNQHEFKTHDLAIFGADAEFEAAGGKKFEWLIVSVPWSKIKSYLQHCEFLDSDHLERKCTFRAAMGSAALANHWWQDLVHGTHAPHESNALWTERFLSMFLSAEPRSVSVATTRARKRKAVLAAEDYMLANLGRCITAEALCRVAGVSRRSLEYYFLEILGISPKAYLRHLRLHEARRLLLQEDPHWGIVGRVARRCGFAHLSDFGRAYQELFHELPAETLRLSISTRIIGR